jgi:hypothetical protein
MHAVFAISDPYVTHSQHTVRADTLQPGMMVQITETDMYRDIETDELVYIDQTWQAQVTAVDTRVWNAPSEVLVSFSDGPGAWVLRDANVPVVAGPVNSSGRF